MRLTGAVFDATQISQYQKYYNTLYLSLQTFAHASIVFIFSWDLQWSQEKLETILTQNFGGAKSIMVFLILANILGTVTCVLITVPDD